MPPPFTAAPAAKDGEQTFIVSIRVLSASKSRFYIGADASQYSDGRGLPSVTAKCPRNEDAPPVPDLPPEMAITPELL
jgi:hypothetical protein